MPNKSYFLSFMCFMCRFIVLCWKHFIFKLAVLFTLPRFFVCVEDKTEMRRALRKLVFVHFISFFFFFDLRNEHWSLMPMVKTRSYRNKKTFSGRWALTFGNVLLPSIGQTTNGIRCILFLMDGVSRPSDYSWTSEVYHWNDWTNNETFTLNVMRKSATDTNKCSCVTQWTHRMCPINRGERPDLIVVNV